MSFWIKNSWYVAMGAADLKAGQLVSRMILGEPLLLFRDAQGEARALEDRCAHRGSPLSLGKITVDGRVRCGYTCPGALRSQGSGSYAGHFLTPETENSTLYHFVAVPQNFTQSNAQTHERVTLRSAEIRQLAFAGQDKPMIRAQYENVTRTGGQMTPRLLSIDTGAVRCAGVVSWSVCSKMSKYPMQMPAN
ncbi:Rieske [2Fe-2S] domain-containing protein [Pseudomonas sp. NFACC52]|nr:Rieske [2Fe-2S] domain-containing protein [Pseudomonas sp. NFACC56-3]SFK30634.1 Rieske [2Fe-2S] domain-containing protein [Pseudomonas sp. NFACC52]